MPRKSNKTAHVLNLLSGHDEKKEGPEAPEEPSSPAPAKPEAGVQNVSVIDATQEDPLASLIQSKLSNGLEPEPQAAIAEPGPEPESQAAAPQPQLQQEPEPQAAIAEPQPEPESQAAAEPQPEPQQEPELPAAAEPEPDFVRINVMERIVQDKIIYFMRQFDVCTCDRCIADATALTLNGLAPKYIVTDRAAADPLLSFYTNKFIVDITVEATKACAEIKENPRH